MLITFVDEGRGPELPEVLSNNNVDKGNVACYFYRVDDVIWLISDRPVTPDVVNKWKKENEDG